MSDYPDYTAFSAADLASYLSRAPELVLRLGGSANDWNVKEIGDGNLNLVSIVTGPKESIIVKQALPYVRLVGESWPLPLYRAFFEYQALKRQAERDPGSVPEVYRFDRDQALIAMEFITPHTILRHKLINGARVENLGDFLGRFCARIAFRGSELSLKSADKKADVALFAGNVAIPAITESLVFTDPYYEAEMNRHNPALDSLVTRLRANTEMKAKVQRMFMKFASNSETLVHGDLHSGSIMSSATESRVIDPEFVQYGPFGFDIGMLIANFLMAYFSQPAHRGNDLKEYQEWILSLISGCLERFEAEFTDLWHTERTGMLYPRCLFEDQGQSSLGALTALLKDIRADAFAICGIEMHRRILSLAHNADFESIEDSALRASLEARNLMMGAKLILKSDSLTDVAEVLAMAREYNTRSFL